MRSNSHDPKKRTKALSGREGHDPTIGSATRAEHMEGRQQIRAEIEAQQDGVKDVVRVMFEKALGGSYKHAELILAYLGGRPTAFQESHSVTVTGDDLLKMADKILAMGEQGHPNKPGQVYDPITDSFHYSGTLLDELDAAEEAAQLSAPDPDSYIDGVVGGAGAVSTEETVAEDHE